jgi:hypothetical protein
MAVRFAFPQITGGRVTDCILSPDGCVSEIWITLDTGGTEIEFSSDCKIEYTAKIHLNSVSGSVAK